MDELKKRTTELLSTLKSKGINQNVVAEKIGVTEAAVSAWKSGRRNVTDQSIKAFCREFNVDYIWFTTGEGEMFSDNDDDVMELIDRIMFGENEFHKNLFKALAKASEEDLKALEKWIDFCADIKKEKD